VPLANGEPTAVLDAIEAHAPTGSTACGSTRCTPCTTAPTCTARAATTCATSRTSCPTSPAALRDGTVDLVPVHFSEVPRLLRRTTDPLVLAAASPPDRHGYFSLGTNADYVASFIGRCPFFLEVNRRCRAPSGATSSTSARSSAGPRPTTRSSRSPPPSPGRVDRAIAGSSPSASPTAPRSRPASARSPTRAARARDHRDLGVHTELLSDGVIDLIEAAWSPAPARSLNRTKVVTTFALGTQRLYDFLHENAASSCWPVDYVNDPRVIARERDFVSINATSRSTSSASARRRRSPAATGRAAAGRPTSPGARCTPRAARASSCCRRPRGSDGTVSRIAPAAPGAS
jgi:hypothetical protein